MPLAGEHTDGHRFLAQAAAKAVGCFVNQNAECSCRPLCVIAVPDTLQALQQLAHKYRLQFSLPVVA